MPWSITSRPRPGTAVDASAAERRRRQDRRNALLVLTGNLPTRPMLAALAGNLVLSALRTVFFLLAKRPTAAGDELAAYTSVAAHPLRLMAAPADPGPRPPAGLRAAWRAATPRAGRSGCSPSMRRAPCPRRCPSMSWAAHHATEDPSDDDSMLVDTGLAQRLLTSPGVLLFPDAHRGRPGRGAVTARLHPARRRGAGSPPGAGCPPCGRSTSRASTR